MVLYAFVGEKDNVMDFSETIVVCDIKVGRFSQLNDYLRLYECQRSRSFIDLHPRSLRFNIFELILLRNRSTDWSQISYGASMGCEEWKFVQLFQVTWPCPYMYGEKLQKSSLRNQEADDLETWYAALGTRVLPVFSYDDPGLTFTIFMVKFVPNVSAWVKAYTALNANVFPSLF